MPVARLTAQACRAVPGAIVDENGDDLLQLHVRELDKLPALVAAGPTPETLAVVARLYVGASAINWKPTQWVTTTLGLAPRTASHWVKLARERHHFGKH